MAAWANGVTDFALAACILILIISLVCVARFVIWPLWPAKFGARSAENLSPGSIVNQPIGQDQQGRVVMQQQLLSPYGYHWSIRPVTVWLANVAQCILFILALSAMSNDNYTRSGGYYETDFGVVRARTDTASYSTSYSEYCANISNSHDKVACATLRLSGALTLIYSLVALLTSFVLMLKMFATSCCTTSVAYHEWTYNLSVLQSLCCTFVIFVWSLGAHITLQQMSSASLYLSASWGLFITCWVLSVLLVPYSRAAIEYRLSGASPILMQVGMQPQLMLVPAAGGGQIMQPVMMGQPVYGMQQQQQQQQQQFPPQQQYYIPGAQGAMQPMPYAQQAQPQYPQQSQPQYIQVAPQSHPPQPAPQPYQGQPHSMSTDAPPPAYYPPEGTPAAAAPVQAFYPNAPQQQQQAQLPHNVAAQRPGQLPVVFPEVNKQ